MNVRLAGRFAMLCFFVLLFVLFATKDAIIRGANENTAEEWKLVFKDDFERKTVGDEWKVLNGEWEIVDNKLGGKGEIIIGRDFEGFHRVEFTAMSEEPVDLSPFIHSNEGGWAQGYFLQFGGHNNEFNILRRNQEEIGRESDHLVKPGVFHEIAGEFDGDYVRLKVDGEVVFEYKEDAPLTGLNHKGVGFYFYSPAYVEEVRVFIK